MRQSVAIYPKIFLSSSVRVLLLLLLRHAQGTPIKHKRTQIVDHTAWTPEEREGQVKEAQARSQGPKGLLTSSVK